MLGLELGLAFTFVESRVRLKVRLRDSVTARIRHIFSGLLCIRVWLRVHIGVA